MPSSRALLIAALLSIPLAVGALVPALAWAALGADVLLLAAIGVDAALARRCSLTAERVWPPLLVQGASSVVEVKLATTSKRMVRAIARETLHPALAEVPLRRAFELAATDAGSWKYHITPRRRGTHVAGPLVVRISGPWQLAWSQRIVCAAESRRVYPQVRWEGNAGKLLALAHRRQLGAAPMRYHGAGIEPYALREYRAGDPPNKIHWRATARHGRLVTREDTWERGMRLVILLDSARAMASIDAARSKLDHALATSLALTRIAASRGDRVTIVAFSDRIERVVRVRSGVRAVAAAYDALFDLEARLAEPAYDLAAETASQVESRSAIAVLLTSVVDLAAAELLREAVMRLDRKHRAVLINLEDPDLDELALGPVDTVQRAFAKASSLEILLNNRRLAKRLRHIGIRVVNTPADRLVVDTLATYLALFQRPAAARRCGGGASTQMRVRVQTS